MYKERALDKHLIIRLVSGCLVWMLLYSFVPGAVFAAVQPSITVEAPLVDIEENTVSIMGKVTGSSGQYVAMHILQPVGSTQEDIIDQIPIKTDGSYGFFFEMPENAVGGVYGVKVTARDAAPVETVFNFDRSLPPNRAKAQVVSNDSDFGMSSPTAIDSTNNTFTLKLTNGQARNGALVKDTDYSVIGLPTGLNVSAKGQESDNTILFTVTGTAASSITSNKSIRVILNVSALRGVNAKSETIGGITLVEEVENRSIHAVVIDGSLSMRTTTSLNGDNNTFILRVSRRTVKDGSLTTRLYPGSDTNFDVIFENHDTSNPLPAGFRVSAIGNSKNGEIIFTLDGSAASAVLRDIPLDVTLRAGRAVPDTSYHSEPLRITLTASPTEVSTPGGGGSGGGGGGGGGAAGTKEPPKVLEYKVSGAVVEELLQDENADQVRIHVEDAASHDEVLVSVDASILSEVSDRGKILEIDTGDVRILAEADTIKLDQDAAAVFKTKRLSAEEAPRANSKDYRFASSAMDIDVTAQAGGKAAAVQLEKPLGIILKYDPALGRNPNKLGVYNYDDAHGQWEYIGSDIDDSENTIRFAVNKSDTYAVIEYDKAFSDLQSHWAKDDVEVMASHHIAQGISDTSFGPDADITRAEFAALMVRTLQLEPIKYEDKFKDVAASAWYADAVQTAAAAGLISGYNGEFRPEDNISREEICKILVEAYKIKNGAAASSGNVDKFKDKNSISSWAVEYVGSADALGLIKGVTADTFEPASKANRAQSVVVLRRLLGIEIIPFTPPAEPVASTPAAPSAPAASGGVVTTSDTADISAPAGSLKLEIKGVTTKGGKDGPSLIDKKMDTRWSEEGDGVWARFDLGEQKTVQYVAIGSWYKAETRIYTFDIEVSTDGTTWTKVYSGKTQEKFTGTALYRVTEAKAQYVRVLGHKNTENGYTAIGEISIFGK